MKVVCKYYVTSVTESKWEGQPADAPRRAEVNLQAVYSKDPTTEDHSFWSASPNGTLKMTVENDDIDKFRPGTYWKIWTEPLPDPLTLTAEELTAYTNEPDVWVLTHLAKQWNSQLDIQLSKSKVNGVFKVSISNQNVWPSYLNKIDSLYRVTFTPFEKG